MRKLKIALLIVVVLVLGFLAVGVVKPRFEYENRIVIDRPVDKVWATFVDVDRMKDWLEGFVAVECLAGKPLEVGSRWKFVFESHGDRVEVIEQVTVVEPSARYGFDIETEPFTGHTELRFSGNGDRTEVVATSEVAGSNLLWRSLLRVMKGPMTEESQKSYEKLKRIVEAAP